MFIFWGFSGWNIYVCRPKAWTGTCLDERTRTATRFMKSYSWLPVFFSFYNHSTASDFTSEEDRHVRRLPLDYAIRTELSTKAVSNILSMGSGEGSKTLWSSGQGDGLENPLGSARRGSNPLGVAWGYGWIEDAAHVAHSSFYQKYIYIYMILALFCIRHSYVDNPTHNRTGPSLTRATIQYCFSAIKQYLIHRPTTPQRQKRQGRRARKKRERGRGWERES